MGRRGPLTAAPYPPIGPRIVVGGVSGSGKTTLARELARRIGGVHIELDSHFHKPGWVESTDEEFLASVVAALAAAGERWVVDGNYSRTRDATWAGATTFVWLDYRRGLATWRAARRTVVRLVRRDELWNGNRERLRNLVSPAHPIFWSWTQHAHRRQNYEAAAADPRWAHLDVVRIRRPRELTEWLRSLDPDH